MPSFPACNARPFSITLSIEEAASRAGVGVKPGAAMNQEALFEKINVKEFVRL